MVQSRVTFGLAGGALLAALLIAAADLGPLAAAALATGTDRSVFSSYMTAQMVWLAAVIAGVFGIAASRLARRLPRSRQTLAIEAGAVGALCVVLLSSAVWLAHVVLVGAITYAIGRWLEVHPAAARRPDVFIYLSLAAGFVVVYWRPSL